MSRSQWTSFYLFRAEPLELFLTDAVRTFVDEVIAEGLATRFFFIRYREGGSHIRLRLHTRSPGPLAERTTVYFNRYFRLHPSAKPIEPLPAGHSPADSIQESRYEPEVSRYGGPKCIGISERQFESSSRAVLAAIAERQWSYESVIGAAIQLHIIFANAIGFSLNDAARFFEDLSTQFMAATGWLPAGLNVDDAVARFADSFAGQRDRLVALHQAIWSAMNEHQEFAQEWANRWARESAETARDLRRARGLRGTSWAGAARGILQSYVHMTNNRLGMRNRDEAYAGYLMARAFREMQ